LIVAVVEKTELIHFPDLVINVENFVVNNSIVIGDFGVQHDKHFVESLIKKLKRLIFEKKIGTYGRYIR
jgi:hypothetical protein